ncbi:tryptase-2-like [Sebastes umbrosus]|uniref:tryptase-2-like n=1 Tax=Sebastes umbrosus TaxID=72105 RepID=UPI00189F0B48|nr:tryptase-2-like [Sebastes umbrosus]
MAFSRVLTVLVLIHNTGGLLGAEMRSSITGGHDAPEGRWPGMVHVNLTDGKSAKWRCSGTILDSQWILTAANCWKSSRHPVPVWHRSFIAVGSYNLQKASARYMEISTVLLHPAYRALSSGYINDIALVKLEKSLRFSQQVAPVSLPSADDTFGSSSECWIVGWVRQPGQDILQEMEISIIPHSVCYVKYPALTSDMLCVGELVTGGKDKYKVCMAFVRPDYDGPLMCRAAGGGYVQVGIMSYGGPDGCGVPGRPIIYTQVSKYLRFINVYMGH